ncbi:MAG: ATP-binding protein [Clostridia bacterium]|nr:ATP-binding protein [Clostridia bacterium]
MGLIRKASELETKSTISMLIYGQPGVGKSTLGMSAPEAVMFDYDNGVSRMHGAHRGLTVQVRSWEDTQKALDEIAASYPQVQTIVIDTVGKMLDYMSEYIMRTNTRMRKNDGTMSLQGYGLRKNMFIEFIRQTGVIGKNVIFIAHEKETKGADGETTVKRPEVGGSSANDLLKELDLVGYVQMVGKQRTISFNPTEWFYAKNTCNLAPVINIPLVVDDEGKATGDNNFVRRVLATYKKNQQSTQEETAKFDRMMDAIDTACAAAQTGADLNAILDSLEKEQVYNSAMVGKKKVEKRGRELGLKADAVSGRYDG